MVAMDLTIGSVAGLFVGMWLCYELGRRYALRELRRDPEATKSGTGVIEAAIFGLMGLLLAFAFSGAASRLEFRQHLIVQEANAIGTAWLRVSLLPPDSQPAIRDLMRRYVDARLTMYDKIQDPQASMAEWDRANRLQGEIWSAAQAASSNTPSSQVTMLVLPAMNERFDSGTTRSMAARTHMPMVIMVLLYVVSLLGAMLSGYAGAGKPRHLLHTAVFTLVISTTVYVIIDLEHPRVGLIRESGSDGAMIQVRQSMN